MTVPASAVLRVLARLTPAGNTSAESAVLDVRAAGRDAVWIGYLPQWGDALPGPLRLGKRSELARLAAIDQLYHEDRVLRAGWTVVTGTAPLDGRVVRVCTPLASWPIRLVRQKWGEFTLTVAGDLEITPLVTDRVLADQLAEGIRFGSGLLCEPGIDLDFTMPSLGSWVRRVCSAAGLGAPPVHGALTNPLRYFPNAAATVGLVIYANRQPESHGVRDALSAWAARSDLDGTALAALYGGDPDATTPEQRAEPAEPALGPLPLSAAQRAVVIAARTEPITVVSGPPGCGKTHALAALALDAIARGESVLLATRSRYAAEVIGGMLRRAAGPTPVLFGDTELRRAIADELAGGLPEPPHRDELGRRERALADAVAAVRRVERAVAAALDDESAASRARTATELAAVHRVSAPALFDDAFRGEVDLAAVRRAVAAARRDRGWPLARWRTERAARRLRALVGAERGIPMSDIDAALRAAQDRRTALRLELTGGTSLGGLRRLLVDADTAACAAAARWLDGVTSAGGPAARGARWLIWRPRCGPAGPPAGGCWPASAGPTWCGHCRCGSARSATSRTCCRRRRGCST